MKFTQPCFIRKNTPELRKRLEELGYLPPSEIWYDENFAICTILRDNVGEYIVFKIDDDFERIIVPSYPYIDCGDNEELFLALAALRDNSDRNQWFIYDKDTSFLQKGDWYMCSLNHHLSPSHKATVKEIIKHFKKL